MSFGFCVESTRFAWSFGPGCSGQLSGFVSTRKDASVDPSFETSRAFLPERCDPSLLSPISFASIAGIKRLDISEECTPSGSRAHSWTPAPSPDNANVRQIATKAVVSSASMNWLAPKGETADPLVAEQVGDGLDGFLMAYLQHRGDRYTHCDRCSKKLDSGQWAR